MNNESNVNNVVSVAPLRNVQIMLKLADTLVKRNINLPGLGVFFGYSGLGKTVASNYVRNTMQAHLVEVRDYWTRKAFVEALLIALHVPKPTGTIATMMQQATRILGDDPSRLLIIDEADKLVDKNMIELVRDIHEEAHVPIILVGEELLPQKLEASERTHNRVLEWAMAELCDKSDVKALAQLFCPNVEVHCDLIEEIIRQTRGKARRIVTTLNKVAEQARNNGLEQINVAQFSGSYFTGRAPNRHEAHSTRRRAG